MRIVFASAFLLILFGAPCRALTQAVPSARPESGEDLRVKFGGGSEQLFVRLE